MVGDSRTAEPLPFLNARIDEPNMPPGSAFPAGPENTSCNGKQVTVETPCAGACGNSDTVAGSEYQLELSFFDPSEQATPTGWDIYWNGPGTTPWKWACAKFRDKSCR